MKEDDDPVDFWKDAEVISAYTREQALEDGVLIDVTAYRGFGCPAAVTEALWPEVDPSRHEIGRMVDLLYIAKLALKNAAAQETSPDPEYGSAAFKIRLGQHEPALRVVFTAHEGVTIGFPEDF